MQGPEAMGPPGPEHLEAKERRPDLHHGKSELQAKGVGGVEEGPSQGFPGIGESRA